MIQRELTITNASGLHARPASEFTRCAAKFKSAVTIAKPGGKAVNAKSIILVLSQGFSSGSTAVLTAEGEDEAEAIDALTQLVANFRE